MQADMDLARIRRLARATLAWVSCGLLAVTSARAGIDKLSPHGGFAAMFAHWGYPAWFRNAVGVVEIAAAGLVMWPRFAPSGATIVLAIMIGAMGTRMAHGETARIPSAELLPTVLAVVVLVLRRRDADKQYSR